MVHFDEASPMPGLPGVGEAVQMIQEAMLLVGALRTAAGADLFRRLEEAPADAAEVAAVCGLDPRGVRHLLALLAHLGLLTCDETDRYRCVRPGLAALDRLLLLSDGIPETMRTGRPVLTGDTPEVPFPNLMGGAEAERCVAYLARPGLRVLEPGAGTSRWSRAIARRQPDVSVTVVDLGRLFTVDWPAEGGFDLVLVPTLCHRSGPEQNERLLARAARALRPGGRVAVIDIMADPQGAASASVALYGLGLLCRTEGGQVYSFASYVQWLRDAGLHAIERHELGGRPPLTMVEGIYSL